MGSLKGGNTIGFIEGVFIKRVHKKKKKRFLIGITSIGINDSMKW